MRIIAVMNGGDWTDAGVDWIEIPDDMDLKEMHRQYRTWYAKYLSSGGKEPFLDFPEFLKTKGATDTDKVEEFWDF